MFYVKCKGRVTTFLKNIIQNDLASPLNFLCPWYCVCMYADGITDGAKDMALDP